MPTKLVFENGCGLTPAKVRKLRAAYEDAGVLNLPADYYVKSIHGLPREKRGQTPVTLILIGKN
jgi:hypothetical protein